MALAADLGCLHSRFEFRNHHHRTRRRQQRKSPGGNPQRHAFEQRVLPGRAIGPPTTKNGNPSKTKEHTPMKRTVNVLSKLNWGTRASAVLVLCATTAIALPAQTLTTLYTFCSQSRCTDGELPAAGLVQAANGDLYGTTQGGGTNDYGTVFKITPSGTLTTLYSFCSQTNCADGAYLVAGLVQAANGDLYGTTENGGGYGTVFKITPGGTLTTLYSFCSLGYPCTDGQYPVAGLVQAANGDLYGTTQYGGTNGEGAVFKISPGGTLTTLYSFCSQTNCTDGSAPDAELVQAANGDLYGTTQYGGTNGGGTVFKITPGGTLTTLYSFCSQTNCTDGSAPDARSEEH